MTFLYNKSIMEHDTTAHTRRYVIIKIMNNIIIKILNNQIFKNILKPQNLVSVKQITN
jgi:hypothetical protein